MQLLYGEYGITDRLTAGYIPFSNKTATKQQKVSGYGDVKLEQICYPR
jgi:hypothetical protein